MKDRIKRIREHYELTQQAFADKLQIQRNNIAGYETGRRSPSDAVISLICREFNVNEKYLRSGEEPMLKELPEEDETAAIVSGLLEDGKSNAFYEIILEIMHTYNELSPKSQEVLRDASAKLLENLQKKKGD